MNISPHSNPRTGNIEAWVVLDDDSNELVAFPFALNKDGKGALRAYAALDAIAGRAPDPYIAAELARAA